MVLVSSSLLLFEWLVTGSHSKELTENDVIVAAASSPGAGKSGCRGPFPSAGYRDDGIDDDACPISSPRNDKLK